MDNINIELLPKNKYHRKKHEIYFDPCIMKPTMWVGGPIGFIYIPSELDILDIIKTNSAILTIQKFVSMIVSKKILSYNGSAVKKIIVNIIIIIIIILKNYLH